MVSSGLLHKLALQCIRALRGDDALQVVVIAKVAKPDLDLMSKHGRADELPERTLRRTEPGSRPKPQPKDTLVPFFREPLARSLISTTWSPFFSSAPFESRVMFSSSAWW